MRNDLNKILLTRTQEIPSPEACLTNTWHIQKVTKDNFSLIRGESMADESQPVARAPGHAVSVPLCQGHRAEMVSSPPFLPNLAGNGIWDWKRHPLPVSQVLT